MTDLKPEDLARLQRIAERAAGMHGADQEHIIDVANEFSDAFGVETVLSLLADRARMEKALDEATTALEMVKPLLAGRGFPESAKVIGEILEAYQGRQALGASQ